MAKTAKAVPEKNTRTRIIENATKQFYERGFERVTFTQIAHAAGISQPALYNHFNDKMEVLMACTLEGVAAGQSYINSFIDPLASAKKKFESYIIGNLKWVQTHAPEAHCLLAVYYYAMSEPLARQVYDRVEQGGRERIEGFLAQAHHEKVWNIKNTKHCAELVHSLLVGEMIKLLHKSSSIPTKQLETKMCKTIFEFVEKGSL